MRARRVPALLAGAGCLAWLALTTGYGVAAAPDDRVDLGGASLADPTSTDPARPSEVGPGLWRASPLAADLPQYFTYQRRISGSRVHVGVAGTPPGTSSDGIRVSAEVDEPDGSGTTDCGSEDDSAEAGVPQAVLGERVVVGGEPGSTGATCRSAAAVRIEVARSGSEPTPLPYVLKIVEEAPSAPLPDDAEPDDEPSYVVPEPAADVTRVPGAASFDEAPRLDAREENVSVRTTVEQGTERLWRVPLTWGDLPVVRVDVPVAEGAAREAFAYSGPAITLHLIDPLRGRLRYVDSGSDDSSTGQYLGAPEGESGEPSRIVAAGFPVSQVDERVPGDYWISVAVAPPNEGEKPVAVPLTVTVAVETSSAAAPVYDDAVLSQDRSAGPEGYSPQRPFLVAEGVFSAVASGSPVTEEGWLTGRRWAGLGLGVASLACLAGGLLRLRAQPRSR